MGILDTLNSVAPALTGLGSIANPLVGLGVGVSSAAINYAMQKRQWQREDSSVQRRIEDLKKAGLNPVLAANGAGAPSSEPMRIGMDAPDLSMSGLSKMQAMQLFNAQRIQQDAAARASIAEAKEKEANATVAVKRANQADEWIPLETTQKFLNNDMLREQIRSASSIANINKKDDDFYSTNAVTNVLKNILGGIGIPGLNLMKRR